VKDYFRVKDAFSCHCIPRVRVGGICLKVYLDPHGHVFTLVELYDSYSSSPVTMDKHVSKNVSQNAYVQAILLSLRCLKPQTADDGPPVHLSRDNTTTFHMIMVKYTKAFTNATRRYYRSVNDDGKEE
jgi:hypothetical protein